MLDQERVFRQYNNLPVLRASLTPEGKQTIYYLEPDFFRLAEFFDTFITPEYMFYVPGQGIIIYQRLEKGTKLVFIDNQRGQFCESDLIGEITSSRVFGRNLLPYAENAAKRGQGIRIEIEKGHLCQIINAAKNGLGKHPSMKILFKTVQKFIYDNKKSYYKGYHFEGGEENPDFRFALSQLESNGKDITDIILKKETSHPAYQAAITVLDSGEVRNSDFCFSAVEENHYRSYLLDSCFIYCSDSLSSDYPRRPLEKTGLALQVHTNNHRNIRGLERRLQLKKATSIGR